MARKNDSKQTIENIIAVSAQLFIEKGYDKTSMQDIVTALGKSKGAIFHHFNSKEAIFNAVMERQFEQVIETVNQWLIEMKGQTAKEKLRGLIQRNLTDEQVIKESASMIASAIENPQMIIAFTQGNLKELAPIIADVLREGREDGSITTEFPDECAEVFLLLLNFWCDTDVIQGDFATLRKRFLFLQYLMKQLGADILEDGVIESLDRFYGNSDAK